MGTFTRVSQDAFEKIQMDAGILVKNFDPANPWNINDEDIICVTTGGINVQCIPQYSDMFEDVDNAPNNTMEGKHLDSQDCKMSTTCVNVDAQTIKMALGAADMAGGRVVPRRSLKQSDFGNVAWIGDLANGGGAAAVLSNALSTGGLNLQTSKNNKGQLQIELTGHYSIKAINKVPMDFYVFDPVEYTVENALTNVTTDNTDTKAVGGQTYLATLTPADGYKLGTATVTMGGTDITSTAYDDGIIVIDDVTGNIVITATGTAV